MSSLAPAVALAHLERRRRDPLSTYQLGSWAAEWIVRHIGAGEIYAHGGNQSGKSNLAAAVLTGLAQGRDNLGGVPLPVIAPPVAVGLGISSYKVGSGGVLQAVRDMLGEWPHHELVQGPSTTALYIRHARSKSDDPREWSKVYVFPYDGDPPEGVRLDAWFADEPPTKRWLDAIRTRGKAGRPLYGLITATPLEYRVWGPIKEEFPEALQTFVNGRARVQWSVFDNRFLSAEDRERLVRAAQSDKRAKARIYGEHVIAEGGCPWDEGVLQQWMSRCKPPAQTKRLVVQSETESRSSGIVLKPVACSVDIWEDNDPKDAYLVVLDSAKGMRDGKHDPDGAEVWSRRRRKQVAVVFGQYIGAWAIGQVGVQLAKMYAGCTQGAILDWERNGIGEVVTSSIRSAGYGNLSLDRRNASVQVGHSLFGFHQTHDTRSTAIAALEQALMTGNAEFSDARVIQQLLDCVIDANGKIVAGPQTHDEHLILAGRALSQIQARMGAVADLPAPDESPLRERFREAVRQEFGRDVIGAEEPAGSAFGDDGVW